MDCLFYCKYLWYYYIIILLFSNTDQAWCAVLFENGGFEIYEATTKTYIENEVYNTIGKPDQDLLTICEIFNYIKTRYYQISR